ncbi:RICIN domain-containing protein [Kitasatospora brasiliensis]|uniref:RICIN domain-containing protein n=1 Tax=Kitasatospora brasiliensis TaxID=3058040 RepID=UPI0029319869|nr:RICIN domain-containing protein [Kitasatospora sp. K002]
MRSLIGRSRPGREGGAARLLQLLAGALAMALAVAGLMFAAAGPAAAQPPPPNNLEDVQAVTYNLQGAGSGDDADKWVKDLPQLIDLNYNMIAIQEAGPAQAVPGSFLGLLPTAPGQQPVQVFQWNVATQSRQEVFYIYYLRTDFGGNRVNLAIVTPWYTNQVLYAPNNGSRPAFGIRINNASYWTAHADSNGGQANNAESTLGAIAAASPNANWLAMGDWNRDPDELPVTAPAGAVQYRSARYTVGFYTGNLAEADYFFTGRPLAAGALYEGERLNAMSSDHTPVGLLPLALRGGAEAVELRSRGDDGNRLTVPDGDTADGTTVITYPPTSRTGGQAAVPDAGPEQTWRPQPFLGLPAFILVNQRTGKCMDVRNGTANQRDLVVQNTCSGQTTQAWYFHPGPDDSATGVLVNGYHTNSCLDVLGAHGNAGSAAISPCGPQDSQQWELATRESSAIASVSNGDRLLDVEGAALDNTAHVVTQSLNGGADQYWHLDSSGPGTFTIVNEKSGKCLDVHDGLHARAGDWTDQYDCAGQPTQNWTFTTGPNGSVHLVNTYYGWDLDVLRNLTGDDRWVGVFPDTGGTNQLWTFQS